MASDNENLPKDPFTLDPLQRHENDMDQSWDSKHHTLGSGVTQAAPGNHKHKYEDISGVPTNTPPHDHAIYALTEHGHSGFALSSHSHPYSPDSHNHSGVYAPSSHTHNYSDPAHTHNYAPSSHGHNPSQSAITPQLHGPFSVAAGAELTIGPIGKNPDEYIFYSLFHASTYLFLSMPSQNAGDFTIKIRNSTSSTNHTGIYVMTLRVRAA